MTPEQIDAMPLDELRLAVAETVMGSRPLLVDEEASAFTRRRQFLDAGDWYDPEARDRVPDYPSDIAAAMGVLCKARGPGRGEFCIEPDDAGYICVLYAGDGSAKRFHGRGSRISEAVCRAALKKAVSQEG